MKGDSKKKPGAKPPAKRPGVTAKTYGGGVSVAVRPVKVRHLDMPPKITKPKRIHPRRVLPFVPEGKERGVHSMDTRAFIHPREAAGQDIQITLNTALTQPGQNQTASNVDEPSVSINGDVVFFTGNWYAAVSVDGGQTFKFIDPNSMAQPNDPQGGPSEEAGSCEVWARSVAASEAILQMLCQERVSHPLEICKATGIEA